MPSNLRTMLHSCQEHFCTVWSPNSFQAEMYETKLWVRHIKMFLHKKEKTRKTKINHSHWQPSHRDSNQSNVKSFWICHQLRAYHSINFAYEKHGIFDGVPLESDFPGEITPNWCFLSECQNFPKIERKEKQACGEFTCPEAKLIGAIVDAIRDRDQNDEPQLSTRHCAFSCQGPLLGDVNESCHWKCSQGVFHSSNRVLYFINFRSIVASKTSRVHPLPNIHTGFLDSCISSFPICLRKITGQSAQKKHHSRDWQNQRASLDNMHHWA